MSASAFLKLYNDLHTRGEFLRIGGSTCLELVDYVVVLPDPVYCLTSFKARNFNLNYCKKEWLWYLNADRYDDSITTHASMWQKLKQKDGGFNSNYGQYIFGQKQYNWVINCLLGDPHSRQACMQLLNTDHMHRDNTDVVCTMGIQFLIRNGKLDMYVHMRSNDAIFGFTNDVFCFAQLQQMVLLQLRDAGMSIDLGIYKHRAGSMHVYERHFDMLRQLIDDGYAGYERIHPPIPTSIYDICSLVDTPMGNDSLYANWMLS